MAVLKPVGLDDVEVNLTESRAFEAVSRDLSVVFKSYGPWRGVREAVNLRSGVGT